MITVYGKDTCPACKTIVAFLISNDIEHQYLLVGQDVTKADVDAAVGRDVRSVPIVLQDGEETTFAELRRQAA